MKAKIKEISNEKKDVVAARDKAIDELTKAVD